MGKRFRFISLLFVCLGTNVSIMIAQNRYRTDLLANMAESSQLSVELDTLHNGCYRAVYSYRKRPLNVTVKDGMVTHIGYLLFSEQQRQAMNTPVYDFLERYLLAADLPIKREKTVNKQLAEDDINFEKGSFSTLGKLVGDTMLNLTVESLDDKRYKVSWYKKEALVCSVDFPVDYDLLHGTEMGENERRIAEEIRLAKVLSPEPLEVGRSDLFCTWQTNYFVLPGDSYYTDQLNTNRYYERREDGSFGLICNSEYPLESLANLLTTLELPNEFIVNLRLKMYDFKEENFSIPLSQFISYFKQQGCDSYFGVLSYENAVATCQLLVRNPAEGYCHTMRVTFDVRQLEGRKGDMNIRLNAYIPVSRIKNLFEELKM